jgi:hypothetical protein
LSDAIWVAASLLFILFGVPGRGLATRFATGIVIGGTVMWLESLLGIAWTRTSLLITMWLVFSGWWLVSRTHQLPATNHQPLRAYIPIALITLLTIYGAATARITCGDLLYFWGPKAQRFFFTQRIDVEFLRFPHYYLMHPDYPPLLPLVYAWSSIAAHRFSYWGAILLTPIYLLATVLAFRRFAAQKTKHATAYATLLAALLAFGFASGRAAGGADPQLIMFEVIALSALTFGDERLIAAIALAGAALTKVEGAAFAAVVIIAYAITRRNVRAVATLATPAILLLGSWIAFAKQNGLLDSYARGGTPLHFEKLGLILYVAGFEASYRAMYLPWIAALAPLAIGRHWPRAALPLLVAAGALLYTVFFYLHQADTVLWIKASADRVLLTPLAALVVASAAASE